MAGLGKADHPETDVAVGIVGLHVVAAGRATVLGAAEPGAAAQQVAIISRPLQRDGMAGRLEADHSEADAVAGFVGLGVDAEGRATFPGVEAPGPAAQQPTEGRNIDSSVNLPLDLM